MLDIVILAKSYNDTILPLTGQQRETQNYMRLLQALSDLKLSALHWNLLLFPTEFPHCWYVRHMNSPSRFRQCLIWFCIHRPVHPRATLQFSPPFVCQEWWSVFRHSLVTPEKHTSWAHGVARKSQDRSGKLITQFRTYSEQPRDLKVQQEKKNRLKLVQDQTVCTEIYSRTLKAHKVQYPSEVKHVHGFHWDHGNCLHNNDGSVPMAAKEKVILSCD